MTLNKSVDPLNMVGNRSGSIRLPRLQTSQSELRWSLRTIGSEQLSEEDLKKWNAIAGHPVAQPFVLLLCWQHLCCKEDPLFVHCIDLNGHSVAMIPLSKHGHFFRRYRVPSHPEVGRVNFAIAGEPSEVMKVLLEHCLGSVVDVLEVPCLMQDSLTYAGLRLAAHQLNLRVIEDLTAEVPVKNLQGGWNAFWYSIGGNTRRKFAQQYRRLERIGRLEFDEVRGGDDLKEILFECFEVEATGYKGQLRTAIIYKDTERTFWLDFAHAAARAGSLSLYTLRLDGRLISYELCLKHSGIIFAMKHGTDARLKSQAPGTALHLEIFRREIDEGGYKLYDFAGTKYEWKRRWTKDVTPMFHLRVYSCTWRGYLAFLLGPWFRRKIKQIPGMFALVSEMRALGSWGRLKMRQIQHPQVRGRGEE